MKCQFCAAQIDPELQGETKMCDRCWEIHSRLGDIPSKVFYKIVASVKRENDKLFRPYQSIQERQ